MLYVLGDPWEWVLFISFKMGMEVWYVGSEFEQNEVKYDIYLEKLQIL